LYYKYHECKINVLFQCNYIKTGKILETLDIKSDKQIPFEVFKRTKDSEYNAEQFRKLIDCITKSQNGVIIKIKIFK